jgi:ABC-type cobalamin/Fe3+-siderophores transport system ATPase subunit
MNKLTSLKIENVKGILSKYFFLDLYPNKPSILVAPNGFGKSSIACAFKSLNNNRIALDETGPLSRSFKLCVLH